MLYLNRQFCRPDISELVVKSSSRDAVIARKDGMMVVIAKEIFLDRQAIEAILGPLPALDWDDLAAGLRGKRIKTDKKFIRAKGASL